MDCYHYHSVALVGLFIGNGDSLRFVEQGEGRIGHQATGLVVENIERFLRERGAIYFDHAGGKQHRIGYLRYGYGGSFRACHRYGVGSGGFCGFDANFAFDPADPFCGSVYA